MSTANNKFITACVLYAHIRMTLMQSMAWNGWKHIHSFIHSFIFTARSYA